MAGNGTIKIHKYFTQENMIFIWMITQIENIKYLYTNDKKQKISKIKLLK